MQSWTILDIVKRSRVHQCRQTSWLHRASQTTSGWRLTFYQWLWVHLIWLSFKAPPWQTERIGVITTESSCPSLLFSPYKVEWGDLAVCLSLRACPSYSSPGRRTSLHWLNRLSRDPISHHLHSPALSPFTTAISSDMHTLLFTHALHGTPMQACMCDLDTHIASPFSFAFLFLTILSVNAHAHTLSDTYTQASLGSIPQPPHQARPDSYYSVCSDAHFSSHLFPYLLAGLDCNNLLTWDVASLPRWPAHTLWAFNGMPAIVSPAKLHPTTTSFYSFHLRQKDGFDIVFATWAK